MIKKAIGKRTHNFLLVLAVAGATERLARSKGFELKNATSERAFASEDGSTIRNLAASSNVQSVLCTLGIGKTIQASRHKTVSQIWYVLEGSGEMWLKDIGGHEQVVALASGVSLNVPVGYGFQFRALGDKELKILIINTRAWSGKGELIPIHEHWPHAF